MIMRRIITTCIAAVTLITVATAPANAQRAPKRAIVKIAGDLYRFQNNFHFSVFYVTPDGVIATDPINAKAAQWLKGEIAKRFGKPVKYLIYSHDHPDHISGGAVFADTATVVAHENARRTIIGEKRPTAVPGMTFTDNLTLELGGRTVELRYIGRNHSDNSIVMRFPVERALFAVDFIPVRTLAFKTMGDSYIPDWMDSLRKVEAMDFDILLPGHGRVGKKSDVRAFRDYMEDLHNAVLSGVRAGKSLDELKRTVKLEKYESWGRYKQYLPLNIEGMHRQITLHRRPG